VRFKSKSFGGFQVLAVTGTNTVSFAIEATAAARNGLLGFAVERSDPAENQRYYMYGFKVFRSVIPQPDKDTTVSTYDHPVQSFVWDDFTAKPARDYDYWFHPLRGKPKALDRTAKPIRVKIRTEPLFSSDEHDVFFNRGVASSQAYTRKFGNRKPDELPTAKRQEALDWLSRELDEAILKFIGSADKADALHCCFYEFRYEPVADALRAAQKKGVDVRIIIDAKNNGRTDKKGKVHPSFPRADNLAMVKKAGLLAKTIIRRDANPSKIQHNKFMVLLKGKKKQAAEVWTGSTNMSVGAITGQTNVGHWLRNAAAAELFNDYWELLATNPGSKGKDAAANRKKNAAFRAKVEALVDTPNSRDDIQKGVTPVFSPRAGLALLDLYVRLIDDAATYAAVTLAFGVNKLFKDQLKNNTPDLNGIVFLLLEKKDKANDRSKDPFVAINASNNVYKAWGAYVKDPVYQWAKETNTRALGLNTHVSYVHSKFLLMDPLSKDPIVVTGSANFSGPSTNANDENMLVIRGNLRVADIYFTEFNRLFNHYYARAVWEDRSGRAEKKDDASRFLDETGRDWLKKYARGTLRAKRVAAFAKMEGFTQQ
jgi:phosphatidylserine/phosphatidylglycerophosphate/cardiolipin synthase-like enzyme